MALLRAVLIGCDQGCDEKKCNGFLCDVGAKSCDHFCNEDCSILPDCDDERDLDAAQMYRCAPGGYCYKKGKCNDVDFKCRIKTYYRKNEADCPPRDWKPSIYPKKCYTFAGRHRCYYTYIPKSFKRTTLLVDLHGFGVGVYQVGKPCVPSTESLCVASWVKPCLEDQVPPFFDLAMSVVDGVPLRRCFSPLWFGGESDDGHFD